MNNKIDQVVRFLVVGFLIFVISIAVVDSYRYEGKSASDWYDSYVDVGDQLSIVRGVNEEVDILLQLCLEDADSGVNYRDFYECVDSARLKLN